MILTYAVAQALMRAQEVKSHLPDGSTQPLSEADLQARAQVEKAFPSLKRIRLSLDFDRWKSARTSADPEVMRAEARSAGISPGATEREVNLARSNATVIWSKTKRRLFPSDVLARQQFLQETGEDWPAEDVLDPAPMPRVVMEIVSTECARPQPPRQTKAELLSAMEALGFEWDEEQEVFMPGGSLGFEWDESRFGPIPQQLSLADLSAADRVLLDDIRRVNESQMNLPHNVRISQIDHIQFLLRLLDTPKVVPPNTLVLASKAWLKGFDHGNNARRRWDTIPRLPAQHSPYATGTKEHGEYQDGYSAGQDAYYS